MKKNCFGIEPEITAKLAKLNCRIYKVGIFYCGRTHDDEKNWPERCFWGDLLHSEIQLLSRAISKTVKNMGVLAFIIIK